MQVGLTQWLQLIERYERCALAHAPPVDGGRVAVLLVTGDDAALAADALAHVEVKSVLLAGAWRARRHPDGRLAQRLGPNVREQERDTVFGDALEERQR
jgi:acyl-CoA synthetase (NDP forming)